MCAARLFGKYYREVHVRNGAASGLSFGVALAGFWDGITLHSILQWHHMISGWVPPTDMHAMKLNMIADGLFDFFCWIATMLALVLLFRESRRAALMSRRNYGGCILVGAGLFNFVEGLIDHQIPGVHHVHAGPNWLTWDIGFLLLGGVVLFAVGGCYGWIVSRPDRSRLPVRRDAQDRRVIRRPHAGQDRTTWSTTG